jgi:hypothetical protein
LSTTRKDFQDPDALESGGVLETRLIKIGRERFADDVWGRTALLTRGASDFLQRTRNRGHDYGAAAHPTFGPYG